MALLSLGGLWQGDPLSPYFYILCGEALAKAVLYYEATNCISFPHMASHGSRVFALQFAYEYDLLFFTYVNRQ